MNMSFEQATFTDPRGQSRTFDQFFVQERLVRYVQIPTQIDIRQALAETAEPRKRSQIQLSKERQNILRQRQKRQKEDAANAARGSQH